VCCADISTVTPYCSASCPTVDLLDCLKPSDCGGTTPDCQATDVLDGMDAGESFPHCTSASLSTKCVAKSVTVLDAYCTATETLHVCAATSDCAADTANPYCCAIPGYSYEVCVSKIVMTVGMLTCM
jgi:hypothetical protein